MSDRPKRKAIPDAVKLEAVLRVNGRCPQCGERLGALKGLQFDHRPALINRDVAEDGTDYVPGQLDPDFIEPLHVKCHDIRTNGPGGEKRITTAGSDKHTRDKTRRLAERGAPQARSAPTAAEEPAETLPPAGKPRPSGFSPPARRGRASRPLEKWFGPSMERTR
jgi:hypothetical protein